MPAEVCHNGLNYIFFSPLPAAPQATSGKEERSACRASGAILAALLHYKIIRNPSPLDIARENDPEIRQAQ
ncbi:hypothetical protein PQH03_08850 [Ralstonia insidiosa]|jgi:hypothetical protein|uniref:hypothetical protein n=1 Tax=Ralstonia TaxID=48736 RepID=UPI0010F6677B|nr:hypothetical protein [Ralstonia insidiosa]MBX3770876.1 hypothetical protein [Ralstonia pickettii]NOZ18652.1 hypothetical protein [Betaproteobacteria bacterium]MBC9964478.1 hypothetical protein [Ralstonia insidiosa]MBX3809847.1 hypothetical protein [Ralstonia pickettii]MBX3814899.1 hypothetical protein [Ralstonia insidiosa]